MKFKNEFKEHDDKSKQILKFKRYQGTEKERRISHTTTMNFLFHLGTRESNKLKKKPSPPAGSVFSASYPRVESLSCHLNFKTVYPATQCWIIRRREVKKPAKKASPTTIFHATQFFKEKREWGGGEAKVLIRDAWCLTIREDLTFSSRIFLTYSLFFLFSSRSRGIPIVYGFWTFEHAAFPLHMYATGYALHMCRERSSKTILSYVRVKM